MDVNYIIIRPFRVRVRAQSEDHLKEASLTRALLGLSRYNRWRSTLKCPTYISPETSFPN